MAYVKQEWEDRQVEKPLTFTMVNNTDGTITLVPYPGIVRNEGTRFTAERMLHIEDGIAAVEEEIQGISVGTDLYNNDAGTNSTSITLSGDVEDYKYVDIQYKFISSNTTYFSTNRVYSPSGKEVILCSPISLSGGIGMIFGTLLIAFSGTTATTRRNYSYSANNLTKAAQSGEMYITRIVGYK